MTFVLTVIWRHMPDNIRCYVGVLIAYCVSDRILVNW